MSSYVWAPGRKINIPRMYNIDLSYGFRANSPSPPRFAKPQAQVLM